jgi:DedD protein
MPSPIQDDRSTQDSRRARVRMGIAAFLLFIAIALLAVLNQRRMDKIVEDQVAPPAKLATITSNPLEAPPAMPEEAPVAALPQTLPANEPPPAPGPGKLPDSTTTPAKASSAPAVKEESAGISGEPFVASANQALSKPHMSAAAVQSPARGEAPPVLSPASPPAPLASKSFEIQLGVFSDIENAQQLQAKLAKHGIPSHTETRVQIGPFKSREEADRAREKLSKLGISAVVRSK